MAEKTDFCISADTYAAKKGLPNIKCWLVKDKNGLQSYALCDDKDWIYASQSYESIGAHIDMMALVNKFSPQIQNSPDKPVI